MKICPRVLRHVCLTYVSDSEITMVIITDKQIMVVLVERQLCFISHSHFMCSASFQKLYYLKMI